jgi:tetratricopeptide (TPR) repeat protein
MDIGLQIKSLLNQAELYRSQGLFAEALDKYKAASDMVRKIEKLKNKESLLKAISDKVQSLSQKTEKVETGPASPELSEKGQNLIKNLFGRTDLEKAVALAKFGQFERAVGELEAILRDDRFRVEAAKNILRCKIAIGTVDDAIDQYHQWLSGDLFIDDQLETVRAYLQPIIDRKGIGKTLPAPLAQTPQEESEAPAASGGIEFSMPEPEVDDEILDVTSIGITLTSGANKGKMVEFDVNFQSGGLLSLMVAKKDGELIEGLNNGDQLEDVQFYSPIAMFQGTAVVANKIQIESGPKRGDYCLDVKVTST